MNKLAIIVDVKGWCWWRRAKAIQRYAPPEYQVKVFTGGEWRWNLGPKFDAVLQMDWSNLDVRQSHPNLWAMVANGAVAFRRSTKSADLRERSASAKKNITQARQLLPYFRGVISINPHVVSVLRSIHSNVHTLLPGVDMLQFRKTKLIHCRAGGVRFGWCGKAFDDPKLWTAKGWHEILLPLMERVPGEYVTNRRTAEDALDGNEMRDFYNSFDVLLVTSSHEGTPSVLIEALACGRSAICTDVGLVRTIEQLCESHGLRSPLVNVGAYHTLAGVPNVIDAMEREVRLLQREPLVALARGAAALAFVKKCLSWERLAETWLKTIFTN